MSCLTVPSFTETVRNESDGVEQRGKQAGEEEDEEEQQDGDDGDRERLGEARDERGGRVCGRRGLAHVLRPVLGGSSGGQS